MWKVHVVDLDKIFLFKIWRVVKKLIRNLTRWNFLIQNLTRRKNFYSKSCFLQKLFHSKSCFLEKVFHSKSWFLEKKIFIKIVLSKIARKTKNLRFLRGKLKQNVILCVQMFFQNLLIKNNFFFRIVLFLKKILFKIMVFKINFAYRKWRVVKFSIPNLTRCKNFISESDTLYIFLFKIMLCRSYFQILAELLSKSYQDHRTTWWKLTMAWSKKDFLRVCGTCLSHVWYNLLGDCVHHGNWFLDGCGDYIICTTNWFIQVSLEFRKWLVYKDFF